MLAGSGCSAGRTGGSGPAPGRTSGYAVAGTELTENEFRYGLAPRPHRDVTYQPDVVLIGGGADAVRSVTADGLTWTIDAKATGASKLSPGKVMFVTSRGVGRVVDAQRAGDAIAVTIAPVEFTEVIRDGTFVGEQPVELDNAISYSSEGAPWTDEAAVAAAAPATAAPAAAPVSAGAVVRPAAFTEGALGEAPAPGPGDKERVEMPRPATGAPKNTRSNGFTVVPKCCRGGVGADLTYDDSEIRIFGSFMVLMDKPRARFHLAVSDGRVTVAELQVLGGSGLRIDLEGASKVGTARQIDRQFTVPVDFSVPVGLVLGVPFSFTVTQTVLVKTAFSAKDGNVKAAGEYAINGAVGFGYRNGSWGLHKVQGPFIRSSLIDSIRGPSVGANGMLLAFKTQFSIGFGAAGFSAGLNVALTVSTGVARGSALDQFFPAAPGTRDIGCRGASLTIDMSYNVGYTIPAIIANVINFFLRVFGAEPIPRTGGIPNPPETEKLFEATQYDPPSCTS
ncbi:hypothetical protein RMN56_06160 [Micromonospora halotolerans]|uniref:Lipoprotein n=1 Tax=Micromonospora halotolerans TaxID=709879 RepID=A0ABZ0A1A8_9ACTN|nr:hypothetical protein [Micromonospora halotolerans]WNM40932.1 hypothetical protein RMN56_06160 [Micromonospora halotolerans]